MSSPKRGASISSRRFLSWNQPRGPIAWKRLFQSVLGIVLAVLLSQLAIFTAQLPQPLHQASLAILAITLLVVLLAIWALGLWVRSLTILRMLAFLVMLYVIPVLVMAIATTGETGFGNALLRATIQIPLTAIQWSTHGLVALVRFPSDFSYAYNSRRSNASIDAVTANDTSLLKIRIPSATTTNNASLAPGALVSLNTQAKRACRLDVLTDDSFFSTKEMLVTEGPQYEEGAVWWRVRNETGSAWCPASVMQEP